MEFKKSPLQLDRYPICFGLQNFLITKNEVPECILDSTEIPQENAKQSLPNYAAQKKFPPFFYDVSIVA
jgi:hypothetical protein